MTLVFVSFNLMGSAEVVVFICNCTCSSMLLSPMANVWCRRSASGVLQVRMYLKLLVINNFHGEKVQLLFCFSNFIEKYFRPALRQKLFILMVLIEKSLIHLSHLKFPTSAEKRFPRAVTFVWLALSFFLLAESVQQRQSFLLQLQLPAPSDQSLQLWMCHVFGLHLEF